LSTGLEQGKIIESARTGIELDKLDEFLNLAETLGITDIDVTDFTAIGGKLILAGNKYTDVTKAWINGLMQSAEDALMKVNYAIDTIPSFEGAIEELPDRTEILREEYRDEFKTALGDKYNTYFEENTGVLLTSWAEVR
jgi:hypothetical protein